MDRRHFLTSSVIATLAAKVLSDQTLARAQAPAAPAAGAGAGGRAAGHAAHADARRVLAVPALASRPERDRGSDPRDHVRWPHADRRWRERAREHRQRDDRTADVRECHSEARTAGQADSRRRTNRGGCDGREARGHDGPAQRHALLARHRQLRPRRSRSCRSSTRSRRRSRGSSTLNQKHGTTLMYHTRAGASSVGGVVWDLLYVLKDFDPKHVGFHWDTGHMTTHGDDG